MDGEGSHPLSEMHWKDDIANTCSNDPEGALSRKSFRIVLLDLAKVQRSLQGFEVLPDLGHWPTSGTIPTETFTLTKSQPSNELTMK